MLAYLFPGQGSQKKGMGLSLFEHYPELVKEADAILGYSIEDLCLNDPDDLLKQTQYTQPALYVVNALSYLERIKEDGKEPDYVAGHSLGEYDALFAAGVFDFATGLKLAKRRGELMAEARNGGMAAVIGMKENEIRKVIEENELQQIDIANLNSPNQIVISGPKQDIVDVQKCFVDAGALNYVVLNVSGAFHSRYMKEAKDKFAEYMEQFELHKPKIPIISNVHARPYRTKDIKETMIAQMVSTVKWEESICYLMGKGDMEFEQIGPGNVITGLVRNIKRLAKPLVAEDEIEEEEVIEKESCKEEDVTPIETPMKEEIEIPCKNERVEKYTADTLGSESFRKNYGLKYAYLTGAMYQGIASKELVVAVGNAGMMGFFGSGGLKKPQIEEAILYIKSHLKPDKAYGINLLHSLEHPEREEELVDLCLTYNVNVVEASAFINMTPALVRYRLSGLRKAQDGSVVSEHNIIAKISRPEVAEAFLSPAPSKIVNQLLEAGKITREQAELSQQIAMADDICAEGDSGGHTDCAVAFVLLPTILRLRDKMVKKYGYQQTIHVGLAGGLGTSEAVAAAFCMQADFVETGSINQCTVEAGTSDMVKNMLLKLNIQDTDYVTASDMFEYGAKMQVVKKGVFFTARAKRLYDLYIHYNSIDEIDEKTKVNLEEKYFRKTLNQVYQEVKEHSSPEKLHLLEESPKAKMAAIFKWYYAQATRAAIEGKPELKVDYQIQCGPAMGAFNRWVEGTEFEALENRHVADIGNKLMVDAAKLLSNI